MNELDGDAVVSVCNLEQDLYKVSNTAIKLFEMVFNDPSIKKAPSSVCILFKEQSVLGNSLPVSLYLRKGL